MLTTYLHIREETAVDEIYQQTLHSIPLIAYQHPPLFPTFISPSFSPQTPKRHRSGKRTSPFLSKATALLSDSCKHSANFSLHWRQIWHPLWENFPRNKLRLLFVQGGCGINLANLMERRQNDNCAILGAIHWSVEHDESAATATYTGHSAVLLEREFGYK